MMKRDYSEKRNFIRMTVNTPVEVNVEHEGVIARGICNDLSASGMLLTVDKALPTDSELLVSLHPESNEEPILQARCTIARSIKVEDTAYILGLEIQAIISEEDAQVA